MTYHDTKKVLKGRQVDMSFGLAWFPLYDRTNTVNRDQNQVGFIWKYMLNDGNLPELCGIYEWRAIRQDQPNRVVYVGSTCTRCGHYETTAKQNPCVLQSW